MKNEFWARGKLMLFGEYLVLRGGQCLAVPLQFGQSLRVRSVDSQEITWSSFEADELWFEAVFSPDFGVLSATDPQKAATAAKLLQLVLNEPARGLNLEFAINFERNWGLGTSSTLLSLLAQWSQKDPYALLEKTFGGSGFDIACATATSAIIYTMKQRVIREVALAPAVSEKLLFVYTGKKQYSNREVKRFENKVVSPGNTLQMNDIADAAAACKTIEDWEGLMMASEELLSGILELAPVKESFADYPHAIKSLGAWGGDFVMATFRDEEEAKRYFRGKGLTTFIDHQHMIGSTRIGRKGIKNKTQYEK